MDFVTTSGERTVPELAARVFGVGERTAVAQEAVRELRKLNPELEHIEELPRGTPIEIPSIEGAEPAEPVAALSELAPAALIADLRAAGNRLRDSLDEEADEGRRRANAGLRSLRSAAIKRATKGDAAASARLADATKSAETRAESARAAKSEWRRAVTELQEDLDSLLDVLAE